MSGTQRDLALLLLAAIILALIAAPALARTQHSGVILLYHRVEDSGPSSTRVTPARFREHLEAIEQGGFHVVPLKDLLDGIYNGGELPDKPIAITFDDAYRSVGEIAAPMLHERKMPYSVFIATDRSDEGAGSFLTWPQMRSMAEAGYATFGAHSLSHAHLEQWRGDSQNTRRQEIQTSVERVSAELGDAAIPVFAYPYGEYSRSTEDMLSELALFGLAQQSGAVGPVTPRTRIPRFPLYIGGDSDERLAIALNAKPMAASDESEQTIFYPADQRPPQTWTFKPTAAAFNARNIRCYAASGAALEQSWINNAWSVTLPPMSPGRNKFNCTVRADHGGGFYWYSRLWLVADEAGGWLSP
jgi:peptidoglycan/xylan/chitin deacetylase (PgdA/CDA1 family)